MQMPSIAEQEDRFKSALSTEADNMYGALCALLGVVAISCNTVAILMFIMRRSKLSPAEYFLLNLMVTSLLFIAVSSPMVAFSSFCHRWMFGDFGAVLHGFLCYFFGILNILSIFLVALVRYLKTCWPHLSHLHEPRYASVYLVLSYLYAGLWSTLPLVGWGKYGVEPHKISASLDWTSPHYADRVYLVMAVVFVFALPLPLTASPCGAPADRVYLVLAVVFVFALPLLGMVAFYLRIIRVSSRSGRTMSKHGRSSSGSLRRRDRKLNILVFLVLGGYVVAWLPYTVVSLHATIVGAYTFPVYVVAVVTLFAKLSGVTNPLCYILVSSRYRKELLELCSKVLHLPLPTATETQQTTNKTSVTDQQGTSFRLQRLRSCRKLRTRQGTASTDDGPARLSVGPEGTDNAADTPASPTADLDPVTLYRTLDKGAQEKVREFLVRETYV